MASIAEWTYESWNPLWVSGYRSVRAVSAARVNLGRCNGDAMHRATCICKEVDHTWWHGCLRISLHFHQASSVAAVSLLDSSCIRCPAYDARCACCNTLILHFAYWSPIHCLARALGAACAYIGIPEYSSSRKEGLVSSEARQLEGETSSLLTQGSVKYV